MKNLFFTFVLFLIFFHNSIAQTNTDKDNQVINIVIESINTKSIDKLIPILASDFTISGQKGEVAKMVLKQIMTQLNDTVLSYKNSSATQSDPLLAKYDITYQRMGVKEATFTFNQEGKLKELVLFPMEVKTMENDSKIEKSQNSFIEIPFKMAGKLIAVEVILNGEKRTFIVDSGCPKVILNSKYLVKEEDEQRISSAQGVSGNISGIDIETVKELNFYGIKLSNQKVISMNLEHLEKSLETEIYGLIGYEMLKEYDILFDYEDKKITLINPDKFEDYKKEHLQNLNFDPINFTQQTHIPIIKMKVGNQEYTCGIDCGAESNLLQDSLFSSLEKQLNEKEKSDLIGADNNSKQVNSAKINQVKIGNTSFDNVKTVFNDVSHLNNSYKIAIDGLIGYEILSKQKTLLSFKRKELIFIK